MHNTLFLRPHTTSLTDFDFLMLDSPDLDTLLRVCNVHKVVKDAQGELPILQSINLELRAGETLSIVGASGSGKSTLLSIMAGLDLPSSGEVVLGGQTISDMNEDDRAQIRASFIGFVFQNFQLIEHLSALENVMLPLELSQLQIPKSQIKELAIEMLSRVGLGERLKHYPRFMSGGEQQRVALARSFVVQPKILMADEPTGSLDHATGQRVLDLMFELNVEFATSLVLVTHDPALAMRCERSVRVEAGRIVPSI
jgi:putative ABC transport system ATP-binding protein